MDCYIVRIYREVPDNPRQFIGTVETVGKKGKQAFTNLDELWQIVNPAMRLERDIRPADRRDMKGGKNDGTQTAE
jgi:hypothetical protein